MVVFHMIDLLFHNFFLSASHLCVRTSTKKFLTSSSADASPKHFQLQACTGQSHCSILLNYLRPSKTVCKIHPNFIKTNCIHNLVAVRHETVTHHGQTFEAILFQHPSFPGLVHAARHYVHVMKEGDPSDFWGTTFQECRHSHNSLVC